MKCFCWVCTMVEVMKTHPNCKCFLNLSVHNSSISQWDLEVFQLQRCCGYTFPRSWQNMCVYIPVQMVRNSNNQTLPRWSDRESFTWIILKTIRFFVCSWTSRVCRRHALTRWQLPLRVTDGMQCHSMLQRLVSPCLNTERVWHNDRWHSDQLGV